MPPPSPQQDPPLPDGERTLADQREWFTQSSVADDQRVEAEAAFMQSKLNLLLTQPMTIERRRAEVEKFGERIKSEREMTATAAARGVAPPTPSGVGFGMIYSSSTRSSFARGTGISWQIICPADPGGNISTWLYLTATNRAALGVEAYVSYQARQDPRFNIFDWARPDGRRLIASRAFHEIPHYLGAQTVHGISCQVISLINTTDETSPGKWANHVTLFNHQTGVWDRVYTFNYSSTLAAQQTGWEGSWGPIVETFQPFYDGTSPLGAVNVALAGRAANGAWSNWAPLLPVHAAPREDNKGFEVLFLDQNFTWAVKS